MFPWEKACLPTDSDHSSVHWIVPTIAGCFLSTSLMLIFVAYLSYLVDVYLMFAASAIAANTIGELFPFAPSSALS